MIDWISKALLASPELAMFLAVAIGFWLGKFKFGNFSLGTVTAALLAGLVIGQVAGVHMNRELRWGLFLLFLFANGYSVGPQFFAALKRDGAKPMVLSVVVTITGVAGALIMGRLLQLDVGMTAGLFAGALTQSAAIGTATDAIMSLPLPQAERTQLANHVAIADALTYVFGAFGVILFTSVIGPALLRVDLRAEARRLEAQLGISTQTPGLLSGAQKFALRAYRVAGEFAGRSVQDIESTVPGQRFFIERIRRGDALVDPRPQTLVQAGDLVVVYGRHDSIVAVGPRFGDEVHDAELMDIPVELLEIVVTNRNVVGPTLAELTRSETLDLRSVGLRKLMRGNVVIPHGEQTVLDRGDVVELIGPQRAIERVAEAIGYPMRPTNTTSLSVLGFGIVIGAAIGLPYLVIGNVRLTLSVSVGALLVGLLFGWLRSVRPTFGTIPAPTLQFMIDFGLAAFVAGAGLQAGPEFVKAVKELGPSVLLAGALLTVLPQLAALAVGHYVLKMNPLLLLGGLAGAQTFTGGLAAVQEKAGSRVPVLGYTVPYATSNILLTAAATLIVAFSYR